MAFYVSGQMLTEDYYVFNKPAKGLVGSNNIDSNSRLCMSSAAAGSNSAYAYPVLYRRIEDARRDNPRLEMIVVDPRRGSCVPELKRMVASPSRAAGGNNALAGG